MKKKLVITTNVTNPKSASENCRKLVFWVITEQLLYHIILKRLHCYEVYSCKESVINHKSETKIFGRFGNKSDYVEIANIKQALNC